MPTGTHSAPAGGHTPAAAHTPDPAATPDPSASTGGTKPTDTPSSSGGGNMQDLASKGMALGESGAAALASSAETETFLAGMRGITAQTNHVQLVMAQLGLQKMLVEGFARFLKEMGKGFKDLAQ